MAVSITWSSIAGGSGLSSLSHGSSANGENTTAQQLYLRHDGLNAITGCKFYFSQKSGSYTGGASAADDYAELLEWGAAADAGDFGGIQINMDAINSFSGGASWGMSESQKSSLDGYKFTVRTGTADTSGNGVTLSKNMSSSMTSDGEIPAGVNDSTFQIRFKVPTNEATTGTRQVDQVLVFSYTS